MQVTQPNDHLSFGATAAVDVEAGPTVLGTATLGVISSRRKSSLLKLDLVVVAHTQEW